MKKFGKFTLTVYWKVDEKNNYKTSVPKIIMFKEQVYGITVELGSTCQFVDKVIRSQPNGLDNNEFGEIKRVFISD